MELNRWHYSRFEWQQMRKDKWNFWVWETIFPIAMSILLVIILLIFEHYQLGLW